jgi:5-(carboxyamino)imidazole ribonucleotide mutase
MAKVAIFMGSKSDLDKVKPCAGVLADLGIEFEMTITSAHRTPDRTENLIREMEDKGCQVFICAAGMAAHLAGAVAARTIRPVIGIPISASSMGGLDALLSTVQMPPGFPVGTVALDKAGAKNAAWLAAQILALNDASLAEKIKAFRQKMQEEVERAAEEIA